MAAFRQVLERARARPRVILPPEQMPIETRIEQLLARLSETEACGFEDLFADVQTRAGMIVTFLALLEMIRLKTDPRVPAGAISGRSGCTSARGPTARRCLSEVRSQRSGQRSEVTRRCASSCPN